MELPVLHLSTIQTPAFAAASLPYPSPPSLLPLSMLTPALTRDPRFGSPLTPQLPAAAHPQPCTSLLRGGDPVACRHGEVGAPWPPESEDGVKRGVAFPDPAPSSRGRLGTHIFSLAEAC